MTTISLLATLSFMAMIIMNLVKRNDTVVALFQLASIFVAGALMMLGYTEGAYGLLVAGVLSLAVKGVLAPWFLQRQITRYESFFAPAAYLKLPMTLISLAVLTGLAHSVVAAGLPPVEHTMTTTILLASIFGMFFFMINRTGTVAQIVGILGVENNVVLFSVWLGIAHSVAIEVAIAFDILVWVVIAITFLTLIHRHFGSLEHAPMTHLKEE